MELYKLLYSDVLWGANSAPSQFVTGALYIIVVLLLPHRPRVIRQDRDHTQGDDGRIIPTLAPRIDRQPDGVAGL